MSWVVRCLSLPAVLVAVLLGCATGVPVELTSTPSGARVLASSDDGLDDFPIGETPTVYEFSFSGGTPSLYNLEFLLDGYESQTVPFTRDDPREAIHVVLERERVRVISRYELVISDDGYRIAPRMVRAWLEDIERDLVGASSILRLGDNQSILGMDMSPDGRTLVFSLAEVIQDTEGNERTVANLRAIRSDGGGITQITSGQWVDAGPAFSGNGEYLYYNSNRLRSNRSDLFRISSEMTGGIAIVRQTPEGFNYHASAADGGIVAFTYRPVYPGAMAGEEQVWTLGGQSGYPTQLREGSQPAVSPDGSTIAYIGRDRQLWVVPVNGQGAVQLTSGATPLEGKKNPSWSPDGRYILYASDEGKDNRDYANYDIWIVEANGRNVKQLTTNGSFDDFPKVSPDQRYIYFVSNRGFKEGVWRIPFPNL